MSESEKYGMTTELQKAKSEGIMRVERIQEIVRDAFSQTIAEVKEGSAEIQPVFKAIKTQLFTRLHQKYTEFKTQTVDLDANLTERYGDRYIAVKQRLEKVAAWYTTVTAQAKTMEPTVLQMKQAEFENKLGEAGVTLAQKERHVKQQLKELLQTAAAKF
jgi:predicted transport protein